MSPSWHKLYTLLAERYGAQHWWPAQTPFEVAVGAILTQNTAWTNVERAIIALKTVQALTPAGLCRLSEAGLQAAIRPAGFYRQKAQRLRALANYLLTAHHGRIETWLAAPLPGLRPQLLAMYGIGPETADAILLYAGGHATFVVDAYTRRIGSRMGLLTGNEPYEAIRTDLMSALPHDSMLYNEYHALLVAHAKVCCRKQRPLCHVCPVFAVQACRGLMPLAV